MMCSGFRANKISRTQNLTLRMQVTCEHIVQSRWMLFKRITAFTVAHSITLALATFGYVYLPALLLNAAIALSILILGVEVVRSRSAGRA